MVTQSIAESLYRELLFTSLILLVILLINNLVLYRQKLTSHFLRIGMPKRSQK